MNRGIVNPLPSMRALSAKLGAILILLVGVIALLSGCMFTPNLPPTAQILADVLEGQPPLSIRFDGTSSTDEDGIISAYDWSFGEGISSQAMRPTHVFKLPGEYAVVLIVTDHDGASSSATVTVKVNQPNAAPVAVFTTVPSAALPNETVQFDASGSIDGDGWIASYQWDFADGTIAEGLSVDHQFVEPGTYPVVLRVVDNGGAIHTLQSEFLVIDTNQAPNPKIAMSSVTLDPGDSLVCNADGSTDPDGTIVSFEWDFGDGTTRTKGAQAIHVYSAAGTYRVTLTATDDLGAKQSTSQIITVGTRAPSPDPDPAPSPEPDPAPSDSILYKYVWSYGGTRSLSLSIPEALYTYYQAQSRGVWSADGYSRFVLDPKDDALMVELRDALLLNNSYQATIENALAFVQKTVTYQPDPAGSEYPRYPVETLVDGVGDCEDSAILYASIVRTFGYSQGVLLVALDTDDDQVMDHIAVFVRVADCFINAHPERSLWTISGKTYALAETAISGGYCALGIDPWGIEQDNICDIWDVGGSTQALHATRLLPP
jgi:PKD repeat protein